MNIQAYLGFSCSMHTQIHKHIILTIQVPHTYTDIYNLGVHMYAHTHVCASWLLFNLGYLQIQSYNYLQTPGLNMKACECLVVLRRLALSQDKLEGGT